ncbi:MAG: glycosyltransferase family 4 protein [Blastocatellales bacterium]
MDNNPRLVCHLIDSNLGSAYFRSIAQRHDRSRFPVMIGSISPVGPLQSAMESLNTPAFSLNVTARWQYPLAVWRLARLIKRRNVSILHAHCFDPTFVGLLAARLAGVPFVFTRHHSDHNIRINKKWHTAIDSWCARMAGHVIAVSEVTREIMIEIEKVPAEKITVVYNGMEPLRAPAPDRIEGLRWELGLQQEPVILMVARLHEEKGHRYLFDALPRIVARIGPITALLAGDGPHRAEIEAEADARGVRDCVRFLGRREEIPELISLASVVTLPSLAESFGFALLEAMSFGKPVVAAATGGMPEVVEDGKCGLIVPPADHEALADAIIRILTEPNLAEGFGQAGTGRAAWFSFERMIRGYEQVYSQTMMMNRSVIGSSVLMMGEKRR